MTLRRSTSLLAALALLAPLAATAWPLCGMAESCPMADAVTVPACHGTAIQAGDCCLAAAAPAAIETVRAVPSVAPEVDVAALPPAAEPTIQVAAAEQPATSAGPLYTLFRALLI